MSTTEKMIREIRDDVRVIREWFPTASEEAERITAEGSQNESRDKLPSLANQKWLRQLGIFLNDEK